MDLFEFFAELNNENDGLFAVLKEEKTKSEKAVEKTPEQLFNENAALPVKLYNSRKEYFPSTPVFSADDYINEGRFALWKAAKSFKSDCGSAFSTYAFKVILNAMLDCTRRQKDLRTPLFSLEQLEDEGFEPIEDEERFYLLNALKKEILSVQDSAPVSIRIGIRAQILNCEGYSTDEIAVICGKSPEWIRTYMMRARMYLRERIAP